MLENKTIGFIGGGQMAEIIFSGVIASGKVKPRDVYISDISQSRLLALEEKHHIKTVVNTENNAGAKSVLENSDIVFLSIKPQCSRSLLIAIKDSFKPNQLVISIMGGITLDYLEGFLPNNPVLRVMPNTPMLVRKGVAGIVAGKLASSEDVKLGVELFETVGLCYVLAENLIESLTSISGSGPAFAFLFIEALADGGVEKGLPRDMALMLAAQMLAGSAEMVLQTNKHPAELKDSVCSPAGGTIAGVHALENGNFRGTVMNAVCESCERMIDVGKKA